MVYQALIHLFTTNPRYTNYKLLELLQSHLDTEPVADNSVNISSPVQRTADVAPT